MKHTPKVRRLENPEFPKWENPTTGAGFIFGAILWILMIIGFLFLAYIQVFSFNVQYLLSLIKPKNYIIPFWFSLLCVIFLFPVTLGIILMGTFIRIIKD